MTQLNSPAIINDINKTLDKDIKTAITFFTKAMIKNIHAKPSKSSISDQENFWAEKFGTPKPTHPKTPPKIDRKNKIIRQAAEDSFYAFH